MVWIITSSWKPFPRICILVSLHYFPLRQTDHWETLWLWNAPASHFHMPGTHIGIIWKGKEGVMIWREAKYSIWLNRGKMWPSPPALPPLPSPGVARGEGEMQGSCLGSPTGLGASLSPGWWWQADSDPVVGSKPREESILYWSRREETLGQDVSEKI